MKYLVHALLLTTLFTNLSYADMTGTVGNGGDVVVCTEGGHTTAELLDYYEGRAIRGLKIPQIQDPSGTPVEEALKRALSRISDVDPYTAEFLAPRVNAFLQEAKFIPNIVFNNIPDIGHTFVPTHCEIQQAAVQSEPQLPGDARYRVSKDLWDLMSPQNQAGLVLHEVIYTLALQNEQTDSLKTRYQNAYFASDDLAQLGYARYMNLLALTHIFRKASAYVTIAGQKFVAPDDVKEHNPGELQTFTARIDRPVTLQLAGNFFPLIPQVSSLSGTLKPNGVLIGLELTYDFKTAQDQPISFKAGDYRLQFGTTKSPPPTTVLPRAYAIATLRFYPSGRLSDIAAFGSSIFLTVDHEGEAQACFSADPATIGNDDSGAHRSSWSVSELGVATYDYGRAPNVSWCQR